MTAIRSIALAGALAAAATAARAEDAASGSARAGGPAEGDAPPWLLGAQLTSAGFLVPGMTSPYRNPALSFGESSTTWGWSLVTTLFGGLQLWEGAIVVAQPEFADGAGAPNVSGLSGYIDGNIIRVAKVGTSPYVARLFFQQIIALGPAAPRAEEPSEDAFMPGGETALRRGRPESRIEITAGKVAATDFFDVATASSDPRHGFMNWSLMTNGAWDYAADTRGYDWGIVVALEQPRWAVRGGALMMPTEANGIVLDGDLAHARSEMLEGELRYRIHGNPGAVKLLGYVNHARMGAFSDAFAAAPPGAPPSVDSVRERGATKLGAGLLVDQHVGPAAAFLRLSWNDARTEEFCFTQIDRAASAGVVIPTAGWGRAGDRVGIGVAVNALAPSHARYYREGGVDFQLGDGRLSYSPEVVLEGYYVLRAVRGLELTADAQGIVNPGMNADRGPAVALGLRVHAYL